MKAMQGINQNFVYKIISEFVSDQTAHDYL
jgi:hypothetical protein